MKRTVYLWLLLCLPYLLPAQGKPGYFALKPGDWFDMQITKHKDNDYYPVMEPLLQFQRQYVLRYQLRNQLPNGNQQYSITLERVVAYTPYSQKFGWMGYDSYYPPYKQGLDKKPPKGMFRLEITANGEIVSLTADKDQPPLPVMMTSYSPQKQVGISIRSTYSPMPPEELHPAIEAMLKLRSINNGIPGLIPAKTEYEYAQLLTGASFPVAGNTLIKGTLAHAHKKQVEIELGGSTFSFPINSRGEFYCPLLLTKPERWYITMENNGGYVFLAPGDTLIIEADADTSRGWQPRKLSGGAKWSSMLAEEVNNIFYGDEGMNTMYRNKTLQEVLNAQESANARFQAVLQTYEGKASPKSIDYFKTNWQYRIADDWLVFLYTHGYQVAPEKRPFQGIPEMITTGIDTMPVAMNSYHDTNFSFYHQYLDWLLIYQQSRISLSAGGSSEESSFYSNYFVLLSMLKGYPLYYKLSKGISESMKANSFVKNQRLKPYFEDFIRNCDDSSIIKPIIKDWKLMEHWAPGNTMPFPILSLANGKTYDLKTQRGKTTCLIFDHASYFQDSALVKMVKKHPEVTFVFAWINEPGFNRQHDPELGTLPNFSSIEIKNQGDKNYEVYGIAEMGKKNVVVLDEWGKIISDHIYSDDNIWDDLNTAIDDAAKAPRFSALQKAGVMNIIGWSLGSILFTVLVGIWIYRVRIQRIKRAEAMKTAIRELEIKAIRSQMNPHFIFNALNSIQSLINTSQYKAANTYLVKFSLLLRSVLHNAEKNMITLADELATIRLYCELEQLRFNFSFEMDTPEELATDLVDIPGMILQPLVENAILHGISSKGKAGLLRITIGKQHAALLIAVYDNGPGYHPEAGNGSHKSVGLKLVRERLQLFSIAGQTASLHISNGNGTTALLTIPIESV
ncbi:MULTISPECIES: sensor histidine kinase [unclassified Chitinophaga]|uniref:sensor histidine kinase n=1 Tax=unclassified Chitinophaga TaxID=2619133 RepID=UPI00301043B9